MKAQLIELHFFKNKMHLEIALESCVLMQLLCTRLIRLSARVLVKNFRFNDK